MANSIRIATRKSPLAKWQAEFVKQQLLKMDPSLDISLLFFTTEGDRRLSSSLAKIGGKGLFIKELEQALLTKKAELAVHSMKDMTVSLPDGLIIGACTAREDSRDALLMKQGLNLESLPYGAVVGTSSLRRQSQLLAIRPDLKIKLLRGNVDTRLLKLESGEYDAIILAAAGLKRLGLGHKISAYLDPEIFIPAVGQGIIGVECLAGNTRVIDLLKSIHDTTSEICLSAERAMNACLGGSCQVPVAGYATLNKDILSLQGRVGSIDGKNILTSRQSGSPSAPEQLGERVARDLLLQGAQTIIDNIHDD